MNIEIINVGTELLMGSTLNTHQQFLAKQISALGFNLYHVSTVGDNPSRLSGNLIQAIQRSDLIIITGGLGPTDDDITLATVTRFLNKKTVLHRPTLDLIKKKLKKRNLKMSKDQEKQAKVPLHSHVFLNKHGTAPGIFVQSDLGTSNKYILLLPGPPRELNPMFINQVMPFIRKKFKAENRSLIQRTITFPSLIESQVATKVKDFLNYKPPVTMGIYAKPGEVRLVVMSKASSQKTALKKAVELEKEVIKRFPREIVLTELDTLADKVRDSFIKKKITLSISESCTGGLVSSTLTSVKGSSKYFVGGFVAYSNKAKNTLLSVPNKILKVKGAVSREVVLAMAKNTQKKFNSNWAIAITGIAGPSGGSKQKKVGLTYISVCNKSKAWVWKYNFIGSRSSIQAKASQTAITHLLQTLKNW